MNLDELRNSRGLSKAKTALISAPVVITDTLRPESQLLISNLATAVEDLIKKTNVQEERPYATIATRKDTIVRCVSQSQCQR